MTASNTPKDADTVLICVPCGHPVLLHAESGCVAVRDCNCKVAGPGNIGRAIGWGKGDRMPAELAAMLTAAGAYLADFRAEDERAKSAPTGLGRFYVDYQAAAYRLAADLHKIITRIQEHQS